MEYLIIYLIGIVDGLKDFLRFFGIISAVAFLGAYCVFKVSAAESYNAERRATYDKGASGCIKGAIVGIVMLFMSMLIPNSKTLVAMVTIPPVINNEQVQQLPENILGFINDYVKEKRDELQGVSGSSGEL